MGWLAGASEANSPVAVRSEVQLPASQKLTKCENCEQMKEKGQEDPEDGTWYCFSCWMDDVPEGATCADCGLTKTKGRGDEDGELWYCEDCWVAGHVPDDAAATGTEQGKLEENKR